MYCDFKNSKLNFSTPCNLPCPLASREKEVVVLLNSTPSNVESPLHSNNFQKQSNPIINQNIKPAVTTFSRNRFFKTKGMSTFYPRFGAVKAVESSMRE
ncbi:hypothetical protein CDAR_437161 [Caerostris darwini]|uniref:Uncharacterized protein n=1 Tax=Caerostris darwini TaxID=1538125 RepID=A0AAV4TVI0_9ARAC|nr:hypothetical protein CDAR_437161 [Caerostris darwini]